MKKITVFSFLAIFVPILFCGCTFNKQITVAGVAFESSKFEYYVGDEINLSDILIMKNVESNSISISYSSSNISVAIINGDCVICLNEGSTDISAEYILNEKTYEISSSLTVLSVIPSNVYALSLNFESSDIVLKLSGNAVTVTPILTPQNCTESVSYAVVDSDIIEINGAVITPLSLGNTIITASIACSETEFITCQINVTVEEDINIYILQNSQVDNEILTTLYSGYNLSLNSRTLYTLCLYSNLNLTDKEVTIEFYNVDDDLLEIFEVVNYYFEEDGQKLYIEYYINAYTGSYIVRCNITETTNNFVGTKNFVFENVFNVVEYITDITITPSYTVNEQTFTLNKNEIGAYTLYNSVLNSEEEKNLALIDEKPYYADLLINLTTGDLNNIEVTFDKENILNYESGLVYVLAAGTVNVIVTAIDGSGVQSTFLFNVIDTSVESFELAFIEYTLYTNGTSLLEPNTIDIAPINISPSYSINQAITYTITEITDNCKLSITENGVVTALAVGTAFVTVTVGAISKTINFTIETLYETVIETSINSITLNVGSGINITYKITEGETNVINQNITYATLVNNIATNMNAYITIERGLGYLYVSANSAFSETFTLRIISVADNTIYTDIIITINSAQE